jgi:hypothetical protein
LTRARILVNTQDIVAIAAAASCRNHPDREAIGICVECRTRVCSECVTKVDGINYCVACLAKLAEHGARRERAIRKPTARWLAHLSAVVLFVAVSLFLWGMLEVALPGGG